MRIGMTLPQMGPIAQPDRVAEFASTAEQLGYESLIPPGWHWGRAGAAARLVGRGAGFPLALHGKQIIHFSQNRAILARLLDPDRRDISGDVREILQNFRPTPWSRC